MRIAIPLLLLACTSAVAQTEKKGEAKTILDKALKAHGGVAGILKVRVAEVTYTVKGSFPGLPGGDDVDITVEETYQLPNQLKKVIKGKAGGKAVGVRTWAIDGDKWWFKEGDAKAKVMDQRADVEPQFRPYLLLETLTKDDDFDWSVGDAGKEPGQVALRATNDTSKADLTFLFDKKTGLLTAAISKVKLPGSGKEARHQTRCEDYKTIDGVQLPMKLTMSLDGKKLSEMRVSRVRFFDKLDDKVFAAP